MELSLRRRRRGSDFKPPKDNRLVLGAMYCLLPLAARTVLHINGFSVDPESLRRLRELETNRVVLLPNHPTDRDSVVMLYLSKMLGERFNYLAARELFDIGPIAWLLQRCGVYSVVRGTYDRKSFRTTVDLLVKGEKKLVIFPEGLTCWQNDTVMPFQEGVPLFGFWALEALKEHGIHGPLHLVPVAIKYVYGRSMGREIEKTLRRLEKKLKLTPADRTPYERLRSVGEAVLSSAERVYGVREASDRGFNDRLQTMKHLLVSRVANSLGVTFKPEQTLPARIRTLVNTLNEITHQEPVGSDYGLDLARERRGEVEHLYDDLSRVLHFVATYDGYVKETMTAERFLDVLGQLEREVFSKRTQHGPCKVHVRVGEPLDLSRLLDDYKKEKRRILASVTSRMEEHVQKMLIDMGRLATPL